MQVLRDRRILGALVLLGLVLLAGTAVFLARGGTQQAVLMPRVAPAPELATPQAASQAASSEKPSGEPTVERSREPSAPVFGAEALEGRLRRIAASHAGRYGVAVYDPASGKTAKVNADSTFLAASIGKLPTLISLYRAAERGEVSLDDPISIHPSDFQSGTGVLRNRPAGTTIPLRRCAYYLINYSDNTAWEMITRYLGRDQIQAEMEAVGADSTGYWIPNTTTPDDVLLMLRLIADPSFTSEAASAEMLRFMTNTDRADRIPAALPPDVRVAHKYGTYATSFGDSGVVFFKDHGQKRHYFIVVLSSGTTELTARNAIREMAGATHRAISGAAP